MRALLLSLILILAAGAAQADWTMCGGASGPSTPARVGPGGCIQFNFVATVVEAPTFRSTGFALISFDPDVLVGTDPTGSAARVIFERCVTAADASDLVCEPVTGVMTGLGGAAATQLRSLRVGPGLYRIDMTIAAAGGELAVIEVQGE